jgi:hypothetical protein
MSFNE